MADLLDIIDGDIVQLKAKSEHDEKETEYFYYYDRAYHIEKIIGHYDIKEGVHFFQEYAWYVVLTAILTPRLRKIILASNLIQEGQEHIAESLENKYKKQIEKHEIFYHQKADIAQKVREEMAKQLTQAINLATIQRMVEEEFAKLKDKR